MKETREFKEIFESDNEKLRVDYTELLERHNFINQELSGFTAVLNTQNEKIENMKVEMHRLTEENKGKVG